MSLVYNLAAPIQVGDLSSSITVSALQLSSISINYEPAYLNAGIAVLSICMIDPVSGYPVNYVYQDASALAMAQAIEAQIGAEILSKLVADGKLPPGALATPAATEPAAPASTAPTATAPTAT